MFERFTDHARRVVVLAQEEARSLRHNYIGTEHILLGLIRVDDGGAARALENLDVTLDTVREQVEHIIGHGTQAPSGNIPFTPRAKKVLELAFREATKLGDTYIGTEHVLLGLIREGEGVAAQVLVRLGADFDRVTAQVSEHLAEGGAAEPPPAEQETRGAGAGTIASASGGVPQLAEIRTLLREVIDRLERIEQRLDRDAPASGEGTAGQ